MPGCEEVVADDLEHLASHYMFINIETKIKKWLNIREQSEFVVYL